MLADSETSYLPHLHLRRHDVIQGNSHALGLTPIQGSDCGRHPCSLTSHCWHKHAKEEGDVAAGVPVSYSDRLRPMSFPICTTPPGCSWSPTQSRPCVSLPRCTSWWEGRRSVGRTRPWSYLNRTHPIDGVDCQNCQLSSLPPAKNGSCRCGLNPNHVSTGHEKK